MPIYREDYYVSSWFFSEVKDQVYQQNRYGYKTHKKSAENELFDKQLDIKDVRTLSRCRRKYPIFLTFLRSRQGSHFYFQGKDCNSTFR